MSLDTVLKNYLRRLTVLFDLIQAPENEAGNQRNGCNK